MRYLVLLAFLGGCAHRQATIATDEPHNLGKGKRFACAMSDGDVYRDQYGQERCVHLRPQAAPQSTTTNCHRYGDSVTCTTD